MKKNHNPNPVTELETIRIGPLDWSLETIKHGYRGASSVIALHTFLMDDTNVADASGDYLTTVWHELLHALSMTYEIPKKNLTEQQVENLAQGLKNLCIDNPEFIQWLSTYSDWVRNQK